jgi:hypothetical protein
MTHKLKSNLIFVTSVTLIATDNKRNGVFDIKSSFGSLINAFIRRVVVVILSTENIDV